MALRSHSSHEEPTKLTLPASILEGATHLASAMKRLTGAAPTAEGTYEAMLEQHGQQYADIWACWKAIEDAKSEEETH